MAEVVDGQAATERDDIGVVAWRQGVERDAILAGIDACRQQRKQAAAGAGIEPGFEDAFLGAPGEGFEYAHNASATAIIGDVETDDREFDCPAAAAVAAARRCAACPHQTIQKPVGRGAPAASPSVRRRDEMFPASG